MKHPCISFLIFFISLSAYSQGYQPFIVEGAHWKMTDGRCDYCGSGINYPQSTFFLWFKLEGDTLINSITYKKLYESLTGTVKLTSGSNVPYCTEWTVSGYLREDTSLKKVFIIGNLTGDCGASSTTDALFIDFSLGQGDTSRMNLANPRATLVQKICMDSAFVVDSVSNTGFQTYGRRTVHLTPASNINAVGYYIYEGIGPSYGLIGGPMATSKTTYSSSLLSYCVGPDSVCDVGSRCSTSGVNNISSRPAIKLYPNPANDLLFVEADQSIKQIELMDITGNHVQILNTGTDKVELHLNGLAKGIYFSRIHFSNTILIQKLIID